MKIVSGYLFRSVVLLSVSCLVLHGCKKKSVPSKTARQEETRPTLSQVGEPPPKEKWTVTASALQEDIYPAKLACDNDPNTRWSSPASDPQWLEVDMGQPAAVSGLTILWETAHASDYAVQTSMDKKNWTEIYKQTRGDGNTDEIYFKPVVARYVRVFGTKRATGWGYSIREMDIKGANESVSIEAPSAEGSDPISLMDGNMDTVWESTDKTSATLKINLKKSTALGGLRIEWGDHYASAFSTFISTDGTNWTKVDELTNGTGNFDVVLHPRLSAQFIRIDMTPANGKSVQIKEITMRGPEETLNNETLYRIAAEKAKPGLYPEQLHKHQVYWTIVGLPGDHEESLLDEYGNLEPVAGSPSLMPYIYINGELLSAFDATKCSQGLENDQLPLPWVQWQLKNLDMKIQALAWGSPGDSVTFTRYKITNTSDKPQKGKLFLAIRPIQVNPPWQYGGLTDINAMEFIDMRGRTAVKINNATRFIALKTADAYGARSFDRGDIAIEMVQGKVPEAKALEQAGNLISGALAYNFDLQPGESKSVIVAAPMHGILKPIDAFGMRGYGEPMGMDTAFDARLSELRSYWMKQIGDVSIEIPDKAVVDTMKSQVAYILINADGVAIQPGSRNYNRSWIRDGGLTSAGMLRMGVTNMAREFLNWYSDRVQPNGWVPPILNNDGTINHGFGWDNEYDSQGEYIFAIMEYYRFTKDRAFLEKHFDRIHGAMKYLVELRNRTISPDYMKNVGARKRFIGILPPSISHEGYSPAVHSYWDDFFALKGFKDGKKAAEILGHHDIAAWAQEQHDLLRDSVRASIEETMRVKKIDYIPGSADKGDMDATSTAIAFFPCDENEMLPQQPLKNTYEVYYKEIQKRLDPTWSAGYTPYEIRNISPFLALNEKDRANFLLDYIMSCRRPPNWNHLAEVVLSDPRMGSYIGDMPHTWVGSGFINSVRNMLVRELDGKLLLLRGARTGWVTERDGIKLRNMPTYYGSLDLSAKAESGVLTVTFGGDFKAPNGLELFWPVSGKPSKVTVNGYEWHDYDDMSCRLAGGLRGKLVAEWE